MTLVHLADLPDDVRDHLVVLEHCDELPDDVLPLDVPDEDYGFDD